MKIFRFQIILFAVLAVCLPKAYAQVTCYRCKSSDATMNGACGTVLNPSLANVMVCNAPAGGSCVTFTNAFDNNGFKIFFRNKIFLFYCI